MTTELDSDDDGGTDGGNDTAGATSVDDRRDAGSPRWPRYVAIGLAGLVVVLLGVLALTQRSRISDLEDTADRDEEVASVAGEFADALLTYDYNDLEASRDDVTDRSTDSFAAQYRQAFDSGLGEQITQLEATSSATINDVLVNRADGDTARVIVVADSEVVSAQGNEARIGSYIDLSLVRIDGAWLVDQVQSVANANVDGGGATPAPAPGDPESAPDTSSPAPDTGDPEAGEPAPGS